MSRPARPGQGERREAPAERGLGLVDRQAGGPCWWPTYRLRSLIALATALLIMSPFLSGCQNGSYQSGYRDGYAEGVTNGQDVGFRDGYGAGFFAARPPGGEMSSAAAGWVKFGAALGGFGLLFGLAYCVYALLAVDFTPDMIAAKCAAIAAALLIAVVTTSLIGAHRLTAPVLLFGRPASSVAIVVIVLLTAGLTFLTSALFRSIVKTRWSKRQQIIISGASLLVLLSHRCGKLDA